MTPTPDTRPNRIVTSLNGEQGLKIIEELNKLRSSNPFYGECSTQAQFDLADGRTLRLGVTDDDSAQNPDRLWIDCYYSFARGYNQQRLAEEAEEENNQPQEVH